MIYFMQPVDGGPVKIGFTDDLETRRKTLQSQYGKELVVLKTMRGDRKTERELHRKFDHLRCESPGKKRSRLEQFRPDRELFDFIDLPLFASANPDTVEAIGLGDPNAISFTEIELAGERWLPVGDWPGYDVSSLGRVRSWWGSGGTQKGRRAIGDTFKIIGGYRAGSGHLSVQLSRSNSTEKRRIGIHVIVLETFVCPKPPGTEACHNDGNPANNRIGNLRWDTRKSNQQDTLRHGTHRHAKLTENDIPIIWSRVLAGESNVSIARDYLVQSSIISQIKSGDSWSHVTKNLDGWPYIRPTDVEIPGKPKKEPIFMPAEFSESPVEIWRVVDGWPAYQCSTFGRIQSRWERVVGGRRGEFRLGENWIDRALYTNKDGHYFLWMSNGIDKKMKYVHSLILATFLCPKPFGYVGCHIDGDKSNNHASNLRWDTVRANARDRERHKKSRLA